MQKTASGLTPSIQLEKTVTPLNCFSALKILSKDRIAGLTYDGNEIILCDWNLDIFATYKFYERTHKGKNLFDDGIEFFECIEENKILVSTSDQSLRLLD